MYEREVDVPRLIAHFRLGPSPIVVPLQFSRPRGR